MKGLSYGIICFVILIFALLFLFVIGLTNNVTNSKPYKQYWGFRADDSQQPIDVVDYCPDTDVIEPLSSFNTTFSVKENKIQLPPRYSKIPFIGKIPQVFMLDGWQRGESIMYSFNYVGHGNFALLLTQSPVGEEYVAEKDDYLITVGKTSGISKIAFDNLNTPRYLSVYQTMNYQPASPPQVNKYWLSILANGTITIGGGDPDMPQFVIYQVKDPHYRNNLKYLSVFNYDDHQGLIFDVKKHSNNPDMIEM